MSVDFKVVREQYSLHAFFEGVMGVAGKNVSGSIRYSACPNCGPSSDASVKCSVRGQKWHCFACEDKGDVIDAASKFFGMLPRRPLCIWLAIAFLHRCVARLPLCLPRSSNVTRQPSMR